MSPGIYIYLKDGSEKYISFNNLKEWKEFATTHTSEDVDKIIVKCYSLNNSQHISVEVVGDELKGFEVCYRAIRIMPDIYRHYVIVYIPGKTPNHYMMINENARLLSTPKIQYDRKKLFYLR